MKIDKLKSFRLLNMYEKLNRGDIINKKQFASEFGISEKSVQRDIDDLRAYLSESYESGDDVTIEYDYVKNGYRLIKQERAFLTNEEIFAVAKVLLESRGFNKQELNSLIDKLMLQATPSARTHRTLSYRITARGNFSDSINIFGINVQNQKKFIPFLCVQLRYGVL